MAIQNPVTVTDILSGTEFAATNYSGLLDVKTEAGHVDYTEAMATGATKVQLYCTAESGTAGNTTAMFVAFAATATAAVAIVNATAGSENGMAITNDIVAGGGPWVIGIPSAFRDGGYLAFAITGANGTDYSTLNIVQGV